MKFVYCFKNKYRNEKVEKKKQKKNNEEKKVEKRE